MRAPGLPHRRARQAHHPMRRLRRRCSGPPASGGAGAVPRGHNVLLGLLCAAALWLLVPGVASAHAHLVQADPAPDSVIARTPRVASFLFDEPLNPALTRVRIADASGRPVTADTGHLASGHNDELWELPLPRLPAGTYSVFWTSESATDGHVMNSFYTFRIAPSGGAASLGAVRGAAAGVYGGGTGSGSGVALSGGVVATTIFSWLGLMAQALWLGALVIELAVLAPARRAVQTPAARLAWAAAPRLWWLARAAPVVAVWVLVGEVLSLAVQGTGGDWGRALAPATLGGILSSQNGRFILLRCAVLLAALLLTGRGRAPALATAPERVRRARQSLGITAPALALPRWELVRGFAALLAAAYMLLVAFSGHAADVTPGWLSYPIDWLHLLFTAAWVGGIAALAYGVLPLRRALEPEERALAVLPLLDRFSPVAYLAVAVLALSGLYNAVNHLDAPARLADTTYGQLLVLKLLLVGLLMLLSASHVWGLRPHMVRLHKRGQRDAHATAGVHEGLATLAARLRLETGVGAAILLATALMGQTLPPTGTSSNAVAPSRAVPAAISGTVVVGNLRAQLTVAPPAVGASTFTLQIREKGTPITANTGAAIIHLYPAAQPTLRASLTPAAHGTRFTVRGSLATTGAWRADVLVRTATVNEYRTLPFTFTVGPGATFLAPGLNPAAITITVDPGQISAPNTFTITGVQASAVRLLSQSLDMNMGIIPYPATSLGGGRWRVGNAYAPMNGRWSLTVQAQKGGSWTTLRQFVYQVPLSGLMHLLTPQASTATTGTSAVPTRPTNLSRTYNVAFARTLPYTGFVTEMGSNGVRVLQTGRLLHTGLQAHGVDVLDGTPYAYVTNFGAEPGTVSKIDVRTMRVVRTFTVGLGPAHVIFTPDHRRAFVTDFRSSDLYMLDLRSGATRRIAFPGDNCFEPHGIDISEDGRTLYVACAGGAWIYTVNTQTLQSGRVVVTAPGAIGVAVDAPRHEAWVTNQTANSVSVVDEKTLRVLATIAVGKGPALLVPTPDGRRLYVANQFGNTVSVIDAARRRVVATIAVAAQPHGPDVTADGKYVYVASIGGNAVTIIRTSDNRVVAVVPSAVGSNEVAIAH
jgi:copper transport protein